MVDAEVARFEGMVRRWSDRVRTENAESVEKALSFNADPECQACGSHAFAVRNHDRFRGHSISGKLPRGYDIQSVSDTFDVLNYATGRKRQFTMWANGPREVLLEWNCQRCNMFAFISLSKNGSHAEAAA